MATDTQRGDVIGDTLYASTPHAAVAALDARGGRVLWQHALRAGRGYANPVTYRTAAGVQYVVVASGGGNDAELVAFALDGTR